MAIIIYDDDDYVNFTQHLMYDEEQQERHEKNFMKEPVKIFSSTGKTRRGAEIVRSDRTGPGRVGSDEVSKGDDISETDWHRYSYDSTSTSTIPPTDGSHSCEK